MKRILTLLVPLLLTTLAARADVIFQDLFTYGNGSLTNLTPNWIKFSGTANPSDMYVYNNQLQVMTTSAYLGVTAAMTRQDDVGRPFATAAGSIYTNAQQVIYVSYIVNFTNLPTANGAYFAMMKNGAATSTFYQAKIYALTGNPTGSSNVFSALPNTFRLGVAASLSGSPAPTGIYPMDLALNTPYQVVMQWDPVTLSALSLWINPISASDPKVTSNDSFTPTVNNISDNYAFRQASGFGGFLNVSNLVVATTFNEAAQNVVAPVAVAPTVVYQPAAITTNFVGDTATIYAVANGQGQGSLTYQWQKSTDNITFVNYSNPLGNTNVVQLDTSTVGNFYYRLVVTTPSPYSLSTTSSSGFVRINPAVGPPSFVTQPVSQTTYSGVNVTLTTTVLSPGNITYTWYSNNVVVNAGQQDSGMSSSYSIPSVTPSSSATYKVAITNDTTTTGIVSTNAVLTVLPVPSVSIAYLRTLVDPNNNYSATNLTEPFQITGVITTATNITSGSTASYYLQDATAGINIFATFGQTFRPAQGDIVTFVGLMSNFSSGLELAAGYPQYPGSYVDNGPGVLPTPLAIPFTYTNTGYANVNTNLAGRLVTLSGVYFPTNAGLIVTNGFISVTNALGQQTYLWFSSQDLDTQQPLPAYASTVTGVIFGGMNGGIPNFAVAVTKFSDIVAATPPVSPNSIAMGTVSTSGGNVNLSWTPTPLGSYTYSVYRTTSLSLPISWTTLTSGLSATSYTDVGGASIGTAFYRVSSP